MVNRDAPYSGLSNLMAMQGRYGDTELVHMSKPEIQGLASLGQLTINPDTGLPEAFSLKSIIPVAGSIIGGMVGGPAGAAIGSGLGTAVTGGSTKDILLSAGLSFASGLGMQALTGAPISAFGSTGGLSSLFGGGAEAAVLPQDVIASGMADPLGEGIVSSAIPQATANIPAATQGLASGAGLGPLGDFANPAVAESFSTPSVAEAMQQQAVSSVTPKSSSSLLDFDINAMRQYTPFAQAEYTLPSGEVLYGDAASAMAKANAGETAFNTVIEAGGTKEAANIAKQSAIKSTTGKPGFLQRYGPLGALGIAGLAASEEEPEEQKLPDKKPVDTGYGDFELVGGDIRRPIPTEEEFRRRAVEGGSQRYFEPYRYVRRAAEGGIVGLQQGGMATPQAPSAMSAMLTPPVQQPQPIQPINIAVQPPQQQPQQPQPMAPMGQGPAPLPDQQKEFMKLMDMEEQVQGQKQAAALQGTSALANLLSSAEGMMQQYPQTSPSGQAVQPPSPPPMTYGSQVNLGLASGGTVNAFGGGFMKIIADMVQQIKDKQSRGEDIKIPFSGGRGMNQLLSGGAYSNTSSPATSTQSLGGAASMNQLLARPVYSRQAAEGGIVEYNQGGMPSQGQPYFEGQVEGPGDGQSDEVAFRVDGGQVDGAMLSPDEYVLAADVVSAIGNGSSDAGAAKLDQFMKNVRQDAYGTTKQMQPFNNQGLTNLVA